MPWEHVQLLIPKLVRDTIGDFSTLLDVGGGGGLVGCGYWPPHIKVTCVDIFEPQHTAFAQFYQMNALDIPTVFHPKSFDVVLCSEMIEHLTKEEGLKLIPILEAVASKMIIFTTPHGFLEQDPGKHPEEPWAKNPHQKHLCGYEDEEFIERGYTVIQNGQDDGGAGYQIIAYKIL